MRSAGTSSQPPATNLRQQRAHVYKAKPASMQRSSQKQNKQRMLLADEYGQTKIMMTSTERRHLVSVL
jgi:hypothetical protein